MEAVSKFVARMTKPEMLRTSSSFGNEPYDDAGVNTMLSIASRDFLLDYMKASNATVSLSRHHRQTTRLMIRFEASDVWRDTLELAL